MKRIVIIGAGIGGCSMAAYLSTKLNMEEYEIVVIEKDEKVGGLCSNIYMKGFRFDKGPSIILMKEIFESFFQELGLKLEDYVGAIKCEPSTKLFINGKTFITDSNPDTMDQMYMEEEGIYNVVKLREYQERIKYYYNQTLDYLLSRVFKWYHLIGISIYWMLVKLGVLNKQYDMLNSYFKSNQLKEALSYATMFMGTSPFDAPSTFSLLDHSMSEGLYYFKGGLWEICHQLQIISERNGVEFRLGEKVLRIRKSNSAYFKVDRIELYGGEEITADYVVCNANLPYTIHNILDDHVGSGIYKKYLDNMEYTCSTVSIYWRIDHPLPNFTSHMFFFEGDYKQTFDQIFKFKKGIPDKPTFYLHIPSKTDSTAAPEGKNSVIVLIPVSNKKDCKLVYNDNVINKVKADVLNHIKQSTNLNLKEHIVGEKIITPDDWEEGSNVRFGAPLGLSHVLTQLAMFRPGPQHFFYHNLWFVGTSTQPGTGLPMIMRGAKLIGDEIINKIN